MCWRSLPVALMVVLAGGCTTTTAPDLDARKGDAYPLSGDLVPNLLDATGHDTGTPETAGHDGDATGGNGGASEGGFGGADARDGNATYDVEVIYYDPSGGDAGVSSDASLKCPAEPVPPD